MGGDIDVDSTPGEGSRFHFTVALRAAPGTAPARRGAVALPEGVKVLVVDDNATNRAIVDAYLVSAGARATGANGGAEALAVMHARDAAGRPHGIAGVIEDITERHRTKQYEAAEHAVVDVLTRTADIEAGVPALLEALCRNLD